MAGIRFYVRSQMRARWKAWGAIALLIGILAGVVLVAAAGARRTGSAYTRFLDASHGSDLLVSPNNSGLPDFYRALERLPGAKIVAPVIGFGAARANDLQTPLLVQTSADGRFGSVVERPKLTAGRMFRPGAKDEVVAGPIAARMFRLHPGSSVRVVVGSSRGGGPPDPSRDPVLRLKVVGIGLNRDDIVSVNALASMPTLFAGPGFAHGLAPTYRAFDGALVTLEPGASRSRFGAQARALARRYPETGGGLSVADLSQQAAKVDDAIRPQAVALGLFAIIAAIVALCAIGLIVARQLFLSSTENSTLAALGMSRRQLLAVALTQVAVVATIGGFLAVGVAVAASPLMPIGPAQSAEPNPGFAFDWLVLGAGFLAIVALVVAGGIWSGWRLTLTTSSDGSRGRSSTRRIRIGDRAMRLGTPPPISIGISQATDPGRGRSALPTRGALAGVAVAISVTVASMIFGANLSRVVQTPRLYGQSWDVTADARFSVLPTEGLVAQLRHERSVRAWTFGEHLDISVGGRAVPAIGLVHGHGRLLAPTVIEGRAARGTGEISLGTKTLAATGRRIGQSVEVAALDSGDRKRSSLRIVGRSVFPFFGRGSFTPTGLGVGAQLREPEQHPITTGTGPPSGYNFVLIKIAPGPAHDANVARVAADLARTGVCGSFNQCAVSTATRPVDIVNYSRVRTTPIALAVLMSVIAVLSVAYLLVSSLYRRRWDFAILKTLGFTRRQVLAAVMGQATTLVALALVVGLPIGIVVGRFAWSRFATNLAVANQPVTPIAILIVIPVALCVANLLAAGPGILAGRLRPAAVFRTD